MYARISAFLVPLTLVLAGLASAQTETGKIAGTVTDPQGGVLPGVTVTATSVSTQSTRSGVTDGNGQFVFASLQPGLYEVRFELSGFRTSVVQTRVTVGGDISVSTQLEIGGLTEVVNVVAAPERIDVRTPEIKTTVSQTQIRELPTLTRNPYDLIALAGNVSDQDPTTQGETSGRGVRGFAINGLRSAATNALLDGAANNDEFRGQVAQSVPLDSVQEFSVISSNFSAQYGRATAGIVNVATKSGANNFFGTAYEFFRNEKISTNTFDNKERKIEKSPFDRHQMGYSLGGPVMRDRLVFFSSLEFTRVRSNSTEIFWVPTPEFLAQTSPATRAFFTPHQLAQPIAGPFLTRSQVASNPGGPFASLPVNLPVFGTVERLIPVDAGGGDPQNTYQFVGRVDWNISANNTAYIRYALEDSEFLTGSVGNSAYRGFDTGEVNNNQNILGSLTRVWSPRLVTQTKVVFNRLFNEQPFGDQPAGPTLYARSTVTRVNGIRIAFPGYLPFNPGSAIPFGGPQKLYQFYEDANWSRGTHDFRFGGSYVYIQDDRTFGAYQNSVMTLGANLQNAMDNLVTGNLLRFEGAVNPKGSFPGDTITLPATQPNFTRNNRYHEFAFYANDSWAMAPRVTVNLGLRYEYYGVQHNTDPRLDSNFYFGQGSNVFQQIRNGSVMIAPDSPVGGLWEKDLNNFAPRVGAAWDVLGDGTTSIRGGYGMAYERNFGNVTFNVIQNPPNYAVVALVAGTDVPTIAITPDNAGPLAGTGTKVLPAVSLRAVRPDIKNAYAHFWSGAFQRQLTPTVQASVEYSGSKGVDLYTLENPNRTGSGAAYLGDASRTARLITSRYTNINLRAGNGKSLYHGVTFGLDSLALGDTGLGFTTKYTLSRAKDNLSSTFSESNNNFNLGLLDPFDPDLDYGYADYDVRNRFAFGGTWEIPVFRNRAGIARTLLGGWLANAIFTAQTGAPFTIFDCSNAITVCNRMIAVGAIPKPADKPKSIGVNSFEYMNLSNQAAGVGSYVHPITGNAEIGPFPNNMAERNAFRRPGKWNVDAIFGKRFRFNGDNAVQLRFEFYNLFNHSNLYIVDSETDVSSELIVKAFRGDTGEGDGAPRGDGQRRMQFGLKFEF